MVTVLVHKAGGILEMQLGAFSIEHICRHLHITPTIERTTVFDHRVEVDVTYSHKTQMCIVTLAHSKGNKTVIYGQLSEYQQDKIFHPKLM